MRKVALVTGGAKRVGRAIVERLAQAGYAVAFTYLSSDRDAEELAGRYGDGACAIHADLTDPEGAVEHIQNALAMFTDHIDVLVNNASLYEPSALEQTDLVQMRRLMTIHYESPLLLTRALSAKLRASRGHVINMVDL